MNVVLWQCVYLGRIVILCHHYSLQVVPATIIQAWFPWRKRTGNTGQNSNANVNNLFYIHTAIVFCKICDFVSFFFQIYSLSLQFLEINNQQHKNSIKMVNIALARFNNAFPLVSWTSSTNVMSKSDLQEKCAPASSSIKKAFIYFPALENFIKLALVLFEDANLFHCVQRVRKETRLSKMELDIIIDRKWMKGAHSKDLNTRKGS